MDRTVPSRPAVLALAVLVACALASTARASVIIIACREGSEQRCPLEPISTPANGVLTYEPAGEPAILAPDGVLHSGWIRVPSLPALDLSAVGGAEIRGIGLPIGVLAASVRIATASADLGLVPPGSMLDLASSLGSGVASLRLGEIELLPGTEFPLLVRVHTSDGSAGRVVVTAVPEPGTGALLIPGLVAFAIARVRRTVR